LLYALWSPKGGSGTSVVCAALATFLARQEPVLLVDLAGDLPAIAGLGPGARPARTSRSSPFPSLLHWLASGPAAPSDALDPLVQPVAEHLGLLPLGGRWPAGPDPVPESGAALAAALGGGPTVVVDAGRADHGPQRAVVEVAGASVLVVRCCYLALRRAVADDLTARALGAVVVEEPGRSLEVADVAEVLGCPVLATVPVVPPVSRAVDAGLLIPRLPRPLLPALRSLAAALGGAGRRPGAEEPGGSGWAA
jgi:hypothetical protein